MNVAVVGASGFTGLELVKIIHAHPQFTLHTLATTQGDITLEALHPALKDVISMDVDKVDLKTIASECELVFLAVPHKTAMDLVKVLMDFDIKIVDLSADYRLDLETYEKEYCPHTDKENIPASVYGLPELYAKEIQNTKLVANPGCYPTSAVLALAPFSKLLKKDAPIFIDAKSGVSGAGKKCVDSTHFVTINENMFAYASLEHRHGAEIQEKLGLLNERNNEVHFVPHLVPITRGMLASVYIQLEEEVDAQALAKEYYKDAPFVRLREDEVQMKQVAGTNFCDLFVKQVGTTVFISSAIDNLLRGASSQAVVNANLMCGFEEDLGIPTIAYAP
ncbi:MAG: N-acetyl-gamma-glutamyl-phosphate reductase [Thiovulaceae bacterium]|nr:N-acetyl-gamma-glutamyl-phosphate reductase [Sulfurimonadaceae bacterium]